MFFLLATSLAPGAAGAAVVQVGNNYEDSATATCANVQIAPCILSFTPVPAGERLTVTGVHCDFYGQNGVLLNARFGVSGSSPRQQPMPLTYVSVASGFRYYSAAIQSTKRIIAAGLTPRVTVAGYKTGAANLNIQITCQLIGTLADVP